MNGGSSTDFQRLIVPMIFYLRVLEILLAMVHEFEFMIHIAKDVNIAFKVKHKAVKQ